MGTAQATDFLENQIIDHWFRTRTIAKPTHLYAALFRVTSQSPRSAAVVAGTNTTLPTTPNGHLYRCTTSGTTGSGEPTWPLTSGATVTDGTAVWTEMAPDFEAGNASATGMELTGGSYARVDLPPLDTNWTATQGGTSGNSSGSGGATSNAVAIVFPAPTANWNLVVAYAFFDALTAGNMLPVWDVLTSPRTILSGDPAPSFAIGQIVISVG